MKQRWLSSSIAATRNVQVNTGFSMIVENLPKEIITSDLSMQTQTNQNSKHVQYTAVPTREGAGGATPIYGLNGHIRS